MGRRWEKPAFDAIYHILKVVQKCYLIKKEIFHTNFLFLFWVEFLDWYLFHLNYVFTQYTADIVYYRQIFLSLKIYVSNTQEWYLYILRYVLTLRCLNLRLWMNKQSEDDLCFTFHSWKREINRLNNSLKVPYQLMPYDVAKSMPCI